MLLQFCSQSAERRSPVDPPQQLERLFSNVNQATMKHEPGSITGSIFLVAGTTLFIFVHTLGTSCCVCGKLFRDHNELIGHSVMGECYPVFTGFWGVMLLWKSASYWCCEWFLGVQYPSIFHISRGGGEWEYTVEFSSRSKFCCCSPKYTNNCSFICIPECRSCSVYKFGGRPDKSKEGHCTGTAIPLALFLVWDAVILGSIPRLAGSGTITDPLEQLRSSNGIVGPIVEAFSFLAIGTSYIGFVLGLSDFIADLLKLPSGQNKPLTYLVTLLPPLVLSLLDPEIFFKALDFAGTYGVLVLFGVLPAALSWSERYSDDLEAPIPPFVPGGNFTLSFVMGGALLVIFSEIFKDIMQLQGLH